ncbi:hypothetical protein [Membranihabitans marinus]|uniref:hypothetical protein n=1 Tax=Membranihabitans marinus TaxID=1227546 RepID=UPI001F2568F8|nr:hypothetical protein [Membranihabitans marinus]
MGKKNYQCYFCNELINENDIICQHCGSAVDIDSSDYSSNADIAISKDEKTSTKTAMLLAILIPGGGYMYYGQSLMASICLILIIYLLFTIPVYAILLYLLSIISVGFK